MRKVIINTNPCIHVLIFIEKLCLLVERIQSEQFKITYKVSMCVCSTMTIKTNYIFQHFSLQLILMTQPHITCMYYVTLSFMVSIKGKMVVDLHNLVFINPSQSVSVLSVCISFKHFIFLKIILSSWHKSFLKA